MARDVFEEGIEKERKVLAWVQKQVNDLSYKLIGEYWEKMAPRRYVEIIKEMQKEEEAAEKWAKSIIVNAYEAGEFSIKDNIDFDTFANYLKKIEPRIFREWEKNARWFSNELKSSSPALYNQVLANGGDPSSARYIGNEAKFVWYEIKVATGYIHVLYDPSSKSVLDAEFI